MQRLRVVEIKIPSKATLRKYGLSLLAWLDILKKQAFVCAICRTLPSTGNLCIEHEHVKGFKRMLPEKRRLYVRGICCFQCNTQYLGRGITVEKARNTLAYLSAYEARRPHDGETDPKRARKSVKAAGDRGPCLHRAARRHRFAAAGCPSCAAQPSPAG